MKIQEAKIHLTILKSDVLTGLELTAVIKSFEKFITTTENYNNRSISWSVEDFKGRAEQNYGKTWETTYDESKFEESLHHMIRSHDPEIGITWDTIDYYLDEDCIRKD